MKRPEPEPEHSPNPLLRNTAVQIQSFQVVLHIRQKNQQFCLHIKTDTLLYIPHKAFTYILAIDTVFVNSYVRVIHKARKCLLFLLNFFSTQYAACCVNRRSACNIQCSCTNLLCNGFPIIQNFKLRIYNDIRKEITFLRIITQLSYIPVVKSLMSNIMKPVHVFWSTCEERKLVICLSYM